MKKKRSKVLMLVLTGVLLWGNGVAVQAETYEYDDLDRLVKVIYDDGGYVEYEYDKNGNIVSTTVHEAGEEEPEAPEIPEESDETDNPEEDDNSDDSDNDGGSDGSDDSGGSGTTDDEPGLLERVKAVIDDIIKRIKDWFESMLG